MKKQAVLVLAMMGVIAGPTWAIRPEKPLDSVHLLNNRAVHTSPLGAGGYIGITAHTAQNDGQKGAITGNSNKIWQQFTARAGRGWSVRWNPVTGTPHLVTGRTIALPGIERLTKENIEAACLDFVAANTDLLKVRPSQLELANKTKAGGRWFVSFRQMYEGVPVLGGGVTMSFTGDDRVIMFGSDVVSDIAVQTQPKLAGTEALRLALADCRQTSGNDRVSEAQLCILPLSRPEGLDYLLCWKIVIFQPTVHKKWQYFIDAVNGNIVGKHNVLVYGNVTGTSSGEYKPEFPGDATEVAPFPYEHVGARGPEVVIAAWNFERRGSNRDWTPEGQWDFGIPTGGESMWSPCSDPNSGYTGNLVYGYNLAGDYEDDMPAYYLTAPPIDCSGHNNVYLEFMRMLGVESSLFDNASIEASNDGSNWTTIWVNPTSDLCDGQWVKVSYNISDVAALQPVVYIRWVMGPTDGSVTYPGWNIDDVKVVSYMGGTNAVETQTDGSYSVPLPWEPSTIISELKGLYCNLSYACGPDALFEQQQVLPDSVVDVTWNSSSYTEIIESSVYWHVNNVHDYYLALDPSLADSSAFFPLGLNYPMPVTVQAGCSEGFCNAYWDGEGMTLGAGDGDFCDDLGLFAEVVYHEYTHGVTEKIYDGVYFPYAMESGAMDEGWSDYFGCLLSPSQSPLVGDGGALLEFPEGFRSLDNTDRRDTDWYDDVHEDSQMFSASLWEIRQAVGGIGRNVIGANTWDQMVHFTRYAHPRTFEEYLLAILVEDDIRYGDRNLTNGTPHGQIIYTAFGDHGIGGLQCLAKSVGFEETHSVGRVRNGKMDPGETGNLSLSLINGWSNATKIRATLSSTDPFVTIVKGATGFPDSYHGDVVDNAAEPFVISLAGSCPQTHTINFTLEVTADGPYSYSRTCLLTYAVAVKQLAYDDGQLDSYSAMWGDGAGMAVRITPQSYPFRPTHVRLFPLMDSSITVTAWDDDGPRGTPGRVLGSIDASVIGADDWVDVDISSLALNIDRGSFYVGYVQHGDRFEDMYFNGIDTDPPYYGRSWAYYPPFFGGSGDWVPFEGQGRLSNLMIRVRH